MALIQALIPLGLHAVGEALELPYPGVLPESSESAKKAFGS